MEYTIEGRADGIFTAPDGIVTIDEIKTTALPADAITGEQSPEHWAQGQVYAFIYGVQHDLPRLRVQLTYYQVDEELTLRFSRDHTIGELTGIVTGLLEQYAPGRGGRLPGGNSAPPAWRPCASRLTVTAPARRP